MFVPFNIIEIIDEYSNDNIKYALMGVFFMYHVTVELSNYYNRQSVIYYKQYNESIMTKYEIMDEEIDKLTKDIRILENVNNFYKEEIKTSNNKITDLENEVTISRKEYTIDNEYLQSAIYNEQTKLYDKIDKSLTYNYGMGPIRYMSIDNIYFHGVGIKDNKKWNVDNRYNRVFFEYNDKKRKLPSDKYDTFDAEVFCKNCAYDETFSKSRKVLKIYRCLGH